ncbi:MAG TPA: hypothetical protein VNM72_03540 [Blastocatellia bacterium]|nr:hypothetical protein [Blastocatellia bacterium]
MKRDALVHIKSVLSWMGWGTLIAGVFVGTFMMGGIVGLMLLHLVAWSALFLILWDSRFPVSEKAFFLCGDCRYHWPLDEHNAICALTEQPAFAPNPACREMRVKRPAA